MNIFSLWNIWYKSVVLSLIWLHSLVCQIHNKQMLQLVAHSGNICVWVVSCNERGGWQGDAQPASKLWTYLLPLLILRLLTKKMSTPSHLLHYLTQNGDSRPKNKSKFSPEFATIFFSLLLSIKSHLWGHQFWKWCLEIHQQLFRRLLWPVVFLFDVFLRCYPLPIIDTDFYITEIVFYSKFRSAKYFLLKRDCTDFKIVRGQNRLKGKVQTLLGLLLNRFPKLVSAQNDPLDTISYAWS